MSLGRRSIHLQVERPHENGKAYGQLPSIEQETITPLLEARAIQHQNSQEISASSIFAARKMMKLKCFHLIKDLR
jgi:hypothetical protein